jgi:hypothetical protein
MKSTLRLVIPAALFGAVACAAYTPIPVPVVGTRSAIDAIAGEWRGSYRSEETGRSGTITFTLAAGRDTAFGEVIMIPGAWNAPSDPMGERVGEPRRAPSLLTISFVQAGPGRVRGTLDQYIDPDCRCPMRTVFTGVLKNEGRLEGSFESQTAQDRRTLVGTWSADRVATKVATRPE